jgi:hypothetical protein
MPAPAGSASSNQAMIVPVVPGEVVVVVVLLEDVPPEVEVETLEVPEVTGLLTVIETVVALA